MKRKEFTERQIVEILFEAQSSAVDDVARNHNITAATICAWRSKFSHLRAEEIKRLRHLKSEHVRLQRVPARSKIE
jgi:hypothetical protein